MSTETIELSFASLNKKIHTEKAAQKAFKKFQSLDDTQKTIQDLLELKYHLEFLQSLEKSQKVCATQRKELIAYIAQLENSIQLRIANLAKKHRISLKIKDKTTEYPLVNALTELQTFFNTQVNRELSILNRDISAARGKNMPQVNLNSVISLKPAAEYVNQAYSSHKHAILANPEQFKNYHDYLNNLVSITTQRIKLLEKKKEQLDTVSWFSDKNSLGRGLNKLGSWIARRLHRTELNTIEKQLELQNANKTEIQHTHDIIYKDGLTNSKAAFIASVNKLKQDGEFQELESTFTSLQQMASHRDLTAIIAEIVKDCKSMPSLVQADTLYEKLSRLVYLQKLLNFLAEKNVDPRIKTKISDLDNAIYSIIKSAHNNFNGLILFTKENSLSLIECIKKPAHTQFIRGKLHQEEYYQFRLFLSKAKEFNINLAKTESSGTLAVELSEFFAAEDVAIKTALYQRLDLEKALDEKSGPLDISNLANDDNKTLLDVIFKYFAHLSIARTIKEIIETYVRSLDLDSITDLNENHFKLINQLASDEAKDQLKIKVHNAKETLNSLADLSVEEINKNLFFLEQFKNTTYSPLAKNESAIGFLLQPLKAVIFSNANNDKLLNEASLILNKLLTDEIEDAFKKPFENLLNSQLKDLNNFIENLVATDQSKTHNIEALCQFKVFITSKACHHAKLKPYVEQFTDLEKKLNEQIANLINNYQFEALIALENDLRKFLVNTSAPAENNGYVGHLLSEKILASLTILATQANWVKDQAELTEKHSLFVAKLAAELLTKTNNRAKYPQHKTISTKVKAINEAIIELLKKDKAAVLDKPALLNARLQFMASLHQFKPVEADYKTITKTLVTIVKGCNAEQLLSLQKNVPALYQSVHEAIATKQEELAKPNKQMSQLQSKMNNKFTQLEQGGEQHSTNGLNYLIYGDGKLKVKSDDAAAFLDDVIMPICEYLDDIEQDAEKNPHLAKQHAQLSAAMNTAITTISEKLIADVQTLAGKRAGAPNVELTDNNAIAPKAPDSYNVFLQRFAFFTKMRDRFDHGDNKHRKVLGQQVMQQFNETAKTQPIFVTQFISNMDGAALKDFASLLLADEQYIDNLTNNDNLVPMITNEGIQYIDPSASSEKYGLLLEDQQASTNELPATTFIRMLSHVVLANIYNLKNLSHQQKNLLKEQFEFLIAQLQLEEKQNSVRAKHLQNNDVFRLNLASSLEKYTEYCRKLVTLIGQDSNNPQADKEIIAKAVTTKNIPKEASADQTALIEATFMLERCEPMVNQLKRGDIVFDQALLNTLIKRLPGQFITWLETPELTQEETAKLSVMALREQGLLPIFTAMERSLAAQIRALKELLSVKDHFAKVLKEIIEQSADDISGDLKNLLHGQHIKNIAALLKFDLVELAQKSRQSLAKEITKSRETKVQDELLGTALNPSFIQAPFATQDSIQADFIVEPQSISASSVAKNIEPEQMDLATLNAKRQDLAKEWNELRQKLLPTNSGLAPIPAFELTEDVTAYSHSFAVISLKDGLKKAEKQLAEIKNHHAKHPVERLKIVAFLNCLQDKHIVKVIRETNAPTYAYIHTLPLSNNKPASSTRKMFSTFARSSDKIDTKQEQALIQLTELYSQGLYTVAAVEILMQQLITVNDKPGLHAIKDNDLNAIVANLTLKQQEEYYMEFSKICGSTEITFSEPANISRITSLIEQEIKTNSHTSIANAKKLIAATEQAIFGYFSKSLVFDHGKDIKTQADLLRRTLDNNSLTEREYQQYNELRKKSRWESASTYQKRDDSTKLYAQVITIHRLIAKYNELPDNFGLSKTDQLINEIEEKCAILIAYIERTRDNVLDKNSSFRAGLDEVVKGLQASTQTENGMDYKH